MVCLTSVLDDLFLLLKVLRELKVSSAEAMVMLLPAEIAIFSLALRLLPTILTSLEMSLTAKLVGIEIAPVF